VLQRADLGAALCMAMATWEPFGAPGHRQALAEFLSQALPAGAGALDILRLSHAFG